MIANSFLSKASLVWAVKRRKSNEWNGLGFQYVGSRETIYVATNIPRKHVLLSYFRNTCDFSASGYSD